MQNYVSIHSGEELKCTGCGKDISGAIGEGDELLPRAYLFLIKEKGGLSPYCYNCTFTETEKFDEE